MAELRAGGTAGRHGFMHALTNSHRTSSVEIVSCAVHRKDPKITVRYSGQWRLTAGIPGNVQMEKVLVGDNG
jgi:hypothetical protein|eukprot:COSAG02_NODE_4757_length_5020_cov_6.889657_1_plen_72_part_00